MQFIIFPEGIENTEKVIWQITQNEITVGINTEEQNSTSMEKVCSKGGSILQRSAESWNLCFFLASAQLLKYFCGIVVKNCGRNNIDIITGLSMHVDERVSNSIDNASWKKTMIFK